MEYVSTERAPTPAGHYSQGVKHNDLVFVSGQLAIDPESGRKMLDSIEVQTAQVLKNMEAVLAAAGTNREHVLKVTLFISDIVLWDRVNDVYKEFFGDHKPARAVVPSRDLHHGFLIELEAIAAIPA